VSFYLMTIKLDRAKEHLQELKDEVNKFSLTNPYIVATKLDPQSQRRIYYIDNVKVIPPRIAAISGDVIQNLRAALDHLAYQLVTRTGTVPSAHIYFPIADDATKYAKQKGAQTQGMPPGALKIIDALKPYRGGDDVLWKLHKLSIVDKHRTILVVGSAFNSMNIGNHLQQTMKTAIPDNPAFSEGIPKLDLFIRPADRLFPLRPGTELFIDEPNARPIPKMQFVFDIAFGEKGVINGEPLIETLNEMINIVERIMLSFPNIQY